VNLDDIKKEIEELEHTMCGICGTSRNNRHKKGSSHVLYRAEKQS